MSEAFVGHEMLNHLGNKIVVSERTLETLTLRNYLCRDRATGLKKFKPHLYSLFVEAEYGTALHRELGSDLAGPNTVKCACRQCQQKLSELDHTRRPGLTWYEREEVERAVAGVMRKRIAV